MYNHVKVLLSHKKTFYGIKNKKNIFILIQK